MKKKLAKVLSFLGVGFFLPKLFPMFFHDMSNLLGFLGLLLAWFQTKMSFNSNEEAKNNQILEQIKQIKKHSDESDRLHDERIAEIHAQLLVHKTQFEHHCSIWGHDGTIQEILSLHKEIARQEASVAIAARISELLIRLDKIQEKVEQKDGGLS